MKIRPLHDRVVIRRTEEERKTPGGIVIPDNAQEKPIRQAPRQRPGAPDGREGR